MNVHVLDDYQDAVRGLPSFSQLAGHSVTVWNDHAQDAGTLANRLGDADAVLLIRERTAIRRELLERLPRLKLVSQFGVVPNIDLAASEALGITVCSRTVPGRPSHATAELTWGLILAATRRIPQEMQHLRAGGWQSRHAMGRTLLGLTLGLFGYGRIGGVVAGYGRAFGMRVLVWGTEGTRERAKADGHDAAPDQQAFFAQSDVLSLHLGLNEGTRGIVGAADFALMKSDALFVNTSRAALVEPGALAAALAAGRPGAAAVDVFDAEPVKAGAEPLLALDNVVATPHIGYVERGGLERMFEAMIGQVLAFDRGEPMNVLVRGTR
jgi:D-3-phosphoglycerate dehydrogenase